MPSPWLVRISAIQHRRLKPAVRGALSGTPLHLRVKPHNKSLNSLRNGFDDFDFSHQTVQKFMSLMKSAPFLLTTKNVNSVECLGLELKCLFWLHCFTQEYWPKSLIWLLMPCKGQNLWPKLLPA